MYLESPEKKIQTSVFEYLNKNSNIKNYLSVGEFDKAAWFSSKKKTDECFLISK